MIDLIAEILQIIDSGVIAGRKISKLLAEKGVPLSGVKFYFFMAEMEDMELVKGWYDPIMIDGHQLKERCYNLTGKGIEQLKLNELKEERTQDDVG